MSKFEYKTVFLPVPIPPEMIDYLNQMGLEGWEAVSTSFTHGTWNNQVNTDEEGRFLSNSTLWHGNKIFVLFKREKN